MILEDVAKGRDNNLNVVRMLAATGVLVSHAWPISLGPGTSEPLFTLTGHSLGTICVKIFFAISGFLITASFLRSSTLTRFTLARVLRLFPGLGVSLVFVALVMGPLTTNLTVPEYLLSPGTWTFFVRNLTLVQPQYGLPSVFTDNPYPNVEGSIWTLFHEVVCYLCVFFAGILRIFSKRKLASVFLLLGLFGWLAVSHASLPLPYKMEAFLGLALPFAMGVAAWLWRDRILLSPWIALTLFSFWLALFNVLGSEPISIAVFSAALTYSVLWIGYMPLGFMRAYNRVGDYSYGMYVYAFPLQGLAIWLTGGEQSPWFNIALSFPLTLICAILSWHLVEKPSLESLKPLLARFRSQTI
ncbi:peptidoglycan/LPS O-acetylase OafA/YrhL [Labrenzia sp. EL_126]|nr:peptidoglycan/LPS O-acetylase OafA/YrhL [Labrenzia sp. EL_126]